jgi:hypothetical protein
MEQVTIIKIASPDELDFELAKRAFYGISHTPERSAMVEQKLFADDVNNFYTEIRASCSNLVQRDYLDSAIQQYKTTYLKLRGEYLVSCSRIVSSFIAGAANFPVRRMEKRNAVSDKRMQVFHDWHTNARKNMAKEIANLRTEQEMFASEVADLEKELANGLQTINSIDTKQGQFVGLNRTAFTTSIANRLERIANRGETTLLAKGLEIINTYNSTHSRPVFTPRHKIWDLAAIAEQTKTVVESQLTKELEVIASGVCANNLEFEIKKNYKLDRLQVWFSGKPEETLRAKLKSNGFNWSPTNATWQRKLNDNALYAAKNILGC